MKPQRRTPLLLLPFVLIWSLFTFAMKLTGRLFAALIGFVLMSAGITLSITFVAAPVGIPLLLLGFLLLLRSIF